MIILNGVPQGLNALIDAACYGRAEAVPFVQSGRGGENIVFRSTGFRFRRDTAPEPSRLGAILRACTRYVQRRLRTRLLLPITGDGCL
jgi:hypothetical protein